MKLKPFKLVVNTLQLHLHTSTNNLHSYNLILLLIRNSTQHSYPTLDYKCTVQKKNMKKTPTEEALECTTKHMPDIHKAIIFCFFLFLFCNGRQAQTKSYYLYSNNHIETAKTKDDNKKLLTYTKIFKCWIRVKVVSY